MKTPDGLPIDPARVMFPTKVEEVIPICQKAGHIPDVCGCRWEMLRLPLLAYARAKKAYDTMHAASAFHGSELNSDILVAFYDAQRKVEQIANEVLEAEEARKVPL